MGIEGYFGTVIHDFIDDIKPVTVHHQMLGGIGEDQRSNPFKADEFYSLLNAVYLMGQGIQNGIRCFQEVRDQGRVPLNDFGQIFKLRVGVSQNFL